jgi:hypothetical protein
MTLDAEKKRLDKDYTVLAVENLKEIFENTSLESSEGRTETKHQHP